MADKRFLGVRRPLYVFALFFLITTAILVFQGERYGLPLALVAAVMLLPVLCIRSLRQISVLPIVAVAVLLASVLVYTQFFVFVQPLQKLDNTSTVLTVRVTELPAPDSKLYRGTVVESDRLPIDTHLCFSFADPDLSPQCGETVKGTAQWYLPGAERQYLYGEKIYLCGYFSKATVTGQYIGGFMQTIRTFRDTLIDGIHEILPGDEGDVLAAVVLGDTASLSDEVSNDFRNSGLTHLLVVSGLHMTVLTGAIASLLKPGRVHRVISTLVILAVLWLFMLLVGFSYSVMRAGVMIHFVLIGNAFRFRADARTSLAVALLLILTDNSYAVRDVGFLLSFAATLGLIILTPALDKMIGSIPLCQRHWWLYKGLVVFSAPLAAMAFTAPIIALFFGRLAILSPMANLMAVWPVTVLLPFAALGALILPLPFGGGIAKGLLFFAGLLAKWVLAVARWIGRLPFSNLAVRHLAVLLMLVLLPVSIYWGWKIYGRRGLRRVLAAGTVLLLLVGSVLTLFSRHTLSVRIAEGEGSLTAVCETAGRSMAIISGEDTDDFYDTRRFFSDCGVTKLDLLVVTDGGAAVTASLSKLLIDYPAKTVVYSTDDLDWTAGITGISREPVKESGAFTFWDRATVYLDNGWCRLDFGETRLVFAPGAKSAVPNGWDKAHLTVFRDWIPDAAAGFVTEQALVVCGASYIPYVTTRLPWGSYPIELVAKTGARTYVTAGKGDITVADRYYL